MHEAQARAELEQRRQRDDLGGIERQHRRVGSPEFVGFTERVGVRGESVQPDGEVHRAHVDPRVLEVEETRDAPVADKGVAKCKVTVRHLLRQRRVQQRGELGRPLDALEHYLSQFDALIMKGVGHYPMLEDPARTLNSVLLILLV